jgi:hypothetical protein
VLRIRRFPTSKDKNTCFRNGYTDPSTNFRTDDRLAWHTSSGNLSGNPLCAWGKAQRGIPGKLQFPYLTPYIPVVPSVAPLNRILYLSDENIKTESYKTESGKQKNEREYYHRGIVSDDIQNVVLIIIPPID